MPMALTFWQRIRVAFRGWSRRREEQQQKFLAKNAGWGTPVNAAPVVTSSASSVPAPPSQGARADREGLQAAYLDRSGLITYYLDVATGEVIESRGEKLTAVNLRQVPNPSNESEAADRRAFIATMEDSQLRHELQLADALAFRKLLATNRTAERSWYSFKNDRATQAIESWIQSLGLK